MVALFGCVWAVVTTAACVLAVASRRSVLAWMKARRWRKSGGDTVEIVRPGLRKVAVYAALVVLALPAAVYAGSTAMPGPSAQGSVGVPTVGGTMTGQLVFSGVTTDITTGTNENLALAPNGTGQVDIQSPIQNSQGTTLDFREAITTNKTDTCNGVAGTEGEVCVIPNNGDGLMVSTASGNIYQRVWAASNGSAYLQLVPNGAANSGYISFYTTGIAEGMYVGAAGGSDADADLAGKNYVLLMNSRELVVANYNDGSAGTTVFRIVDNAGAGTGAGTTLLTVDAAGNVKLDSGATRTRGTITLAAGTGTATVASGAICVCTDTTANASVKCAVSATTLTATGTGTDVIAYICL